MADGWNNCILGVTYCIFQAGKWAKLENAFYKMKNIQWKSSRCLIKYTDVANTTPNTTKAWALTKRPSRFSPSYTKQTNMYNIQRKSEKITLERMRLYVVVHLKVYYTPFNCYLWSMALNQLTTLRLYILSGTFTSIFHYLSTYLFIFNFKHSQECILVFIFQYKTLEYY